MLVVRAKGETHRRALLKRVQRRRHVRGLPALQVPIARGADVLPVAAVDPLPALLERFLLQHVLRLLLGIGQPEVTLLLVAQLLVVLFLRLAQLAHHLLRNGVPRADLAAFVELLGQSLRARFLPRAQVWHCLVLVAVLLRQRHERGAPLGAGIHHLGALRGDDGIERLASTRRRCAVVHLVARAIDALRAHVGARP